MQGMVRLVFHRGGKGLGVSARGAALAAGLALVGALGLSGAQAQSFGAFEFASPPSAEANRVYGVNRKSGEMSACQFERPAGSSLGITRCFALGEGAKAQTAGRYGLVATHFAGETGIFRVNYETGDMSICYVRDLPGSNGKVEPTVLCTPQAH